MKASTSITQQSAQIPDTRYKKLESGGKLTLVGLCDDVDGAVLFRELLLRRGTVVGHAGVGIAHEEAACLLTKVCRKGIDLVELLGADVASHGDGRRLGVLLLVQSVADAVLVYSDKRLFVFVETSDR